MSGGLRTAGPTRSPASATGTPTRPALPEAAIWHDVECGAYAADLPLWRSLARQAGGPILDVGAGTGRVTLDLARRGHPVTAVDVDAGLLDVLRQRADGLPVRAVLADARNLELGGAFSLCLVPMQTIQLLGGPAGRRAFLTRARGLLAPEALLAAAIAEDLPPFEPDNGTSLPDPDVRELDGWVYASQPVAIRRSEGQTVLERVRRARSPDGSAIATPDVVRLDHLSVDELQDEARAAGFGPLPAKRVAPTDQHAASLVVMLRA